MTFKREHRYYVVKRKHLTQEQDEFLSRYLAACSQCEPKLNIECVVVESDWPIYESTWNSIMELAKLKEGDKEN